MPFVKVPPCDSFRRLALDGQAGVGKTFSALLLAPRLADIPLEWGRGVDLRHTPVPLTLEKSATLAWIREQLAIDPTRIQRDCNSYDVAHLENRAEGQVRDRTVRLWQQAQISGKAAGQ